LEQWLAFFYAPKSGRELRNDLLTGLDQGRDLLLANGRDARSTVKSWVNRSQDAIDDTKDQINSAVDRGKRVAGLQKDKISSAIDAGREAIHKATAD